MTYNYEPERMFGYVRVSTESQESNYSLQNQKEALMGVGVPLFNITEDVGSAKSSLEGRPILYNLIQELKAGDVLFVQRLDRCARNTKAFLALQDILFKREIAFISLDLPFGSDPSMNLLLCTLLSAIAEFETSRIAIRQKEGIQKAKELGVYTGRKTIITDKFISRVRELKEANMTVTDMALVLKCSRTTVYKVLRLHLGYSNPNALRKVTNAK